MSRDVKRLFEQFQPQKYLLEISVNEISMTFKGKVAITGQRRGRPSQRLTLHQKGLKITNARITRHDKKDNESTVSVDRINHHKSFDEVRLHTEHTLYQGKYTINLEFEGAITHQMNGVYPCFFEHNGEDKKLFATQFESHHAREVFPCIDEPEAKAVFELALTHPSGAVALSNTPIRKQTDLPQTAKHDKATNYTLTEFEPTPIMSTYLLAFVFGDLEYKQAETHDGIIVRAYATPDNVELTTFALEVAVKCLEFYSDYFGIQYPIAKCDLIALPDFASGAMENWVCITFREQTMLVDPKNSTLTNKQYVALVVAHELTHQWFGNLVTMRWWTDLWLNEGFASWMEYLAVDHLFPDWQLWTQFAIDEQHPALQLDALEHTHPIEVPVHHPDEIRTIFDTISYSKGASVIHMLHEYLGKTDFRNGLRHYLTKHQYGNTNTTDLWTSLETISKKPVGEFMRAWTAQPGFPLVTATIKDNHVELTQQRFLINPKHDAVKKSIWPIPLLAEGSDQDTLNTPSIKIKIKPKSIFKLNQGQSGFYRTAYDNIHLQELGKQIKQNRLAPLDRLGILTDLFESAKAGHSSTTDALGFLINYFTEETNYAVWDVIASIIGNLRLVMDDETLRENIKPHIRHIIKSELKRLGWNRKKNDSHFDMLLRPIIISLAASSDEPSVIKQCQDLFANINDTAIDPDLRGTIFTTVARLGDKPEFDKLLELHNRSTLSEERTTIATALTGFTQSKLNSRALELINSKSVRLQDVSYWIAYSFLNRYSKNATWEWLKNNWGWLQESVGNDLSFFRMPIYAARVFSNASFIDEYTKFFSDKLSPAFDRPYKQGLEVLQVQTAWKTRDLEALQSYFKSQSR